MTVVSLPANFHRLIVSSAVLSLQSASGIALHSVDLHRGKVPPWIPALADEDALYAEIHATATLGSLEFKVAGIEGKLRYTYKSRLVAVQEKNAVQAFSVKKKLNCV